MQDASTLTQRVKQVAGGWEDRLRVVTDEVLEFETLVPVIQAFDALQSGVTLRLTQEVLTGTWDALREGRADLVVGATNEPPIIAGLHWFELGVMDWVFAVSPRHPLAKAKEPLDRDAVIQHRSIVVADTSRRLDVRGYGVQGGQATLAVRSMRAKIEAQRQGLGVGWLPRDRVDGLLKRGELIEKEMVDPREPNQLFVAWRGDHLGRGLEWWLKQLKEKRLAARLVRGIDVAAVAR